MTEPINAEIADRLDEVASLLEEQRANRYRVEAYRGAARTMRNLDRPVSEIATLGGIQRLKELRGIGDNLARSIFQIVATGRLPMLDRLRGESDPVALLSSVPGIGRILAERLHDDLGIDSLEELEAAAHDGRLEDVEGFGGKRLAGIRETLASRLGRVRARAAAGVRDSPPVSEILDVDSEYRDKAERGLLARIAPHRFNPSHEAWLPVLHTSRGKRHYTALFSNTARARQMRTTRNWVVIYYDGGAREQQSTVITSRQGPLKGQRIVRGREDECLEYYQKTNRGPRRNRIESGLGITPEM